MSDAKIWDRMAKRYIAGPIGDLPAYTEKLRRTQACLTPETELFEFGCGSGMTALKHAPLVRHIDAIDFSSVMIDHAKRSAAAEGVSNVDFHVSSLEDWPEGARYDVVMGMSILHLVRDRAATLAKVRDLLKPGGLFISSTTCLGPTSILRPLIAIPSALGLLPKVAFIDGTQLKAEIEGAGFTILDHWQPKPRAAHFIIAQKPGDGAKVNVPAH